ncbi:MAG: cytochrome c [Paracoccaceae bacterium]|jgi:cytochrome c
MKTLALIAALGLSLVAAPSFAGDADKGEDTFKKCKACHAISNGDNVIVKGGKTGPNLYGVIGHKAGALDGFNYGSDLVAAGDKGLVWTEELLAKYVEDPKDFLQEYLGDKGAKSKMSYKLKKGGEDVAAYLAAAAK